MIVRLPATTTIATTAATARKRRLFVGALGRGETTCRSIHNRNVVAMTFGHDGGADSGRPSLANLSTPKTAIEGMTRS